MIDVNIKAYKRLVFDVSDLCHYCHKPMKYGGNKAHCASIEHVIPRSEGGTSASRNLRLVHSACNSIENWLHQTGRRQ